MSKSCHRFAALRISDCQVRLNDALADAQRMGLRYRIIERDGRVVVELLNPITLRVATPQ